MWSPHWKTKMGYPCSSSLSFKAHDHGLALQAAFQHLFNLGLLSPSFFSSSNESSCFSSLVGSEENDNNEAWRLSTALHTNIHTSNTRNTDDAANADTVSLSLCYISGTHACILTHTCNVRWMQVAISFCFCHIKWANMSVVYIYNLLQSLHLMLYYRELFYILL